ncbi:hypothetical protein D3C87_1553450 [compost metagenome]
MSLVTNETGNIDLAWIKSDNISQKFKEPTNLLLFKVITHAPVTKHLKKCRMAVIAYVFNVLRTKTGLAIDKPVTFWMLLTKKIWQEGLHATASKERRWIILEHEWCTSDNLVLTVVEELKIGVTDLLSVHICPL